MENSNFTPREIVSELDRYIISQDDAKKAVAIALRNRWRRQQVPQELRDEIVPKNIIMIGSTGIGKTEIARRLAKLAKAPFIKVEASKFTEVGYVGKDVESIIRDLTDLAVKMVREEETKKVKVRARELAEEKLLDLLLPAHDLDKEDEPPVDVEAMDVDNIPSVEDLEKDQKQRDEEYSATREKLREMLHRGELNEREVTLHPRSRGPVPMIEVISSGSIEEVGMNLKDMFSNIFPQGSKQRKMKVQEALEFLAQEESQRLINMDDVTKNAIQRVEQSGIVFLDEIDKIVGKESNYGPDVSRGGVQRDILPIVEGSTVTTKYGMVKTDHVLFIAAGAFHTTKPSDLIPELQGRFPIRVELKPLTKGDFLRILTEPKNSLTKQYIAMMKTEKVGLEFTEDALDEICEVAVQLNDRMENIGARRLHTVMEKLLEEISFEAPERNNQGHVIDKKYVQDKLSAIIKDYDLSKYIL